MSTNIKSRVTRSSTRESTKNASSNNGIATPTNDSTTTTTASENNTNSTNNNANANVLNPRLPLKIDRRKKKTNTPIEAGESKIPNTNTTTPSDTKNDASNNPTTTSSTTTPSNTTPTIITITTPTTTTSTTSTTTTSETNNSNNANSHNTNAAASSSSYTLTAHENLEPNSLNNSSSSISTIDVTESSSATNTPQTSNLTKIPSNITESIQATSLTENATMVNPPVVENHNHNHHVHSSNINSVNTPPSSTSPPLHLQFTLEDEREFQKRVDEELKDDLVFTPPSSPQNKEDDDSENEKPIPSDCMDAVSAFDFPTLINPKRPIRVEPQPHPQPKKRKSPEESSTDHDRFLLAGFSELRNLETELYTREIIARLESQVFAFYQSILRRDSLIKKLIKDIEEKDLIIQSIPKELLVNWGVLANLQKRQ